MPYFAPSLNFTLKCIENQRFATCEISNGDKGGKCQIVPIGSRGTDHRVLIEALSPTPTDDTSVACVQAPPVSPGRP